MLLQQEPWAKNLSSQAQHAVWPAYFPPYCDAFPCHTSVWLPWPACGGLSAKSAALRRFTGKSPCLTRKILVHPASPGFEDRFLQCMDDIVSLDEQTPQVVRENLALCFKIVSQTGAETGEGFLKNGNLCAYLKKFFSRAPAGPLDSPLAFCYTPNILQECIGFSPVARR